MPALAVAIVLFTIGGCCSSRRSPRSSPTCRPRTARPVPGVFLAATGSAPPWGYRWGLHIDAAPGPPLWALAAGVFLATGLRCALDRPIAASGRRRPAGGHGDGVGLRPVGSELEASSGDLTRGHPVIGCDGRRECSMTLDPSPSSSLPTIAARVSSFREAPRADSGSRGQDPLVAAVAHRQAQVDDRGWLGRLGMPGRDERRSPRGPSIRRAALPALAAPPRRLRRAPRRSRLGQASRDRDRPVPTTPGQRRGASQVGPDDERVSPTHRRRRGGTCSSASCRRRNGMMCIRLHVGPRTSGVVAQASRPSARATWYRRSRGANSRRTVDRALALRSDIRHLRRR
jgi:hypothetical protein